jgi:hypothetical protein
MGMRGLRTIAAAAIAAAFIPGAQAQSAGDPRVQRAPGDGIFAAIGIVRPEYAVRVPGYSTDMARSRGTGFLVSPCFAFTNYHVVFGGDVQRGYPQDPVVSFSAGGLTTTGRPVAWGDVDGSDGATISRQDWALLRLDRCIGAEIGWFPMEERRPKPGTKLVFAGFPIDKPLDNVTAEFGCAVLDHPYVNLLYSCISKPGNSGGPVLAMREGVPVAIGINTGWHEDDYLREKLAIARAGTGHNMRSILIQLRGAARTAFADDLRRNLPNPMVERARQTPELAALAPLTVAD